jgi:hypothetical protein
MGRFHMQRLSLKKLLCALVIAFLVPGCAGLGKFTPQGAALANNAVTVATGLLHALDGFYGDLLNLKLVPDCTPDATKALSMADLAAGLLKQIIADATVTDAQLNTAAGQVEGAKAILNNLQKS